jgi:hypothetical protein
MKLSHCLIASLATIVTPFLAAHAQEPGKPLPETRIVLRVSGKFIQGLLGIGFQRDETIDENVNGIAVTGTARVAGKLHVRLHESHTESNFDVLIRGEVLSQLAATRRPVVVLTHGTAPFSVCQPIVHRDQQFMAHTPTMDVRNHFTLDQICSYRRGLTGALTRRIARPFVRRGLADGDSEADEKIRIDMTPVLEAEMGKLVLVLNKIPPLVQKGYELIILESKLPPDGARFYHAATKEHLLISFGKPNQHIARLPNLDKDKQAPLELWIGVSKNASKEERRKLILQNWRLITPYLRAQIQMRSPQLTKELDEPLDRLLEEVQIHEMPGWHVLTFAPRIPLPAAQTP